MEENNNVESTLSDTKQVIYNTAVVKSLKDASNIGSEMMRHNIEQKKSTTTGAASADETRGNILGKSNGTSSVKTKTAEAGASTRTSNILGERYQSPIKKASANNMTVASDKKVSAAKSAAKAKEHIVKHQKINHILRTKDKASLGKKGVEKVTAVISRIVQVVAQQVGQIFLLSAAAFLPVLLCLILPIIIVVLAVGSSSAYDKLQNARENSASYADCIAYNQGDAQWSFLPVGGSSSFGSSGCCLTCIATCIASWGYPEVTPATVWRYAKSMNGYDNTALGQNVIRSMIPNYGLQLQVITNVKDDFDQIENALSDGKYVIVFVDDNNGNPGYFFDKDTGARTKVFTSRTHFFVLIGREDGYIVCMDPNGGEIRYTTPDELKKAYHCMDYAQGAGYGYEAYVVWNASLLPEGEFETEE